MAVILRCPRCQSRGLLNQPLRVDVGSLASETGLVTKCLLGHTFPVPEWAVNADDRDYVAALASDLVDSVYGPSTSSLHGVMPGHSRIGPRYSPACYYLR